jgi:hypothetical protein
MLYLRSLAHAPFGDGANGNRNRKVGIHIQPGQCGRRLDDKYRVVTCLPPPQSSAVESGRLDSIIARFCPSGGSAGTFATVSATSGLIHRVVAEWASSVRVHARCDLSLFRTPIASQCGIHQKIIPGGMIIRTISAIIHSIFVFLCDVNGRALRKPSCAGRLRAHDTAFARVG